MLLSEVMKKKYDYFIEEVNEPLVKAITILVRRYPEPTHENVLYKNSHRLLDIRDEFFRCWDTRGRHKLYEALWRVVIVKYEHSANYRNFIDWTLMMIQASGWKPFEPDRQMELWKGGKP